MRSRFRSNTYPPIPKHGFCAFGWGCSYPKCGCQQKQNSMGKLKTERREIVGFRVKKSDVRPVNELVKNFLKTKGYKFYEERKHKSKVPNLHTKQRTRKQPTHRKAA